MDTQPPWFPPKANCIRVLAPGIGPNLVPFFWLSLFMNCSRHSSKKGHQAAPRNTSICQFDTNNTFFVPNVCVLWRACASYWYVDGRIILLGRVAAIRIRTRVPEKLMFVMRRFSDTIVLHLLIHHCSLAQLALEQEGNTTSKRELFVFLGA